LYNGALNRPKTHYARCIGFNGCSNKKLIWLSMLRNDQIGTWDTAHA